MQNQALNYNVYLLRIWEERNQGQGQPARRFSMEDPHTGLRRGFGSMEELITYLQESVNPPLSPNG